MTKNCAICGKEFEAVRSSKTCTGKCSKIRKKEYDRKYQQTPERKVLKRQWDQSPKGKEYNRNRKQSPECKEVDRRYKLKNRPTSPKTINLFLTLNLSQALQPK